MDKLLYIDIPRQTLLPFIQKKYPDGHRFMADNDPKHTSKLVLSFLEQNNVNWWRTPTKWPDVNPIENLWHELKNVNCAWAHIDERQEYNNYTIKIT
uniref:Tc1-like transposase DDE domain-containing protein n=1 Tax=Amphimedon queenslandica TaxID=400682 RepID=A0A1X7U6G8_AMPQE